MYMTVDYNKTITHLPMYYKDTKVFKQMQWWNACKTNGRSESNCEIMVSEICPLMPQSHLLRLWVWLLADEHLLKNLAGTGGIRWAPLWLPADFYMPGGHQ